MNIAALKFFITFLTIVFLQTSISYIFFNEYFINRGRDSVLFLSFFIVIFINKFMGESMFIKLLFFIIANLTISFIFFDGSSYKKIFYVMSFICNFTLYEVIGLSFYYSNIYKDFFDIDVSVYYIILYSVFLIILYLYIKFIRDENSDNFDLNNMEYFILTIVPLCNLVILMVLEEYSSKISLVLMFVVLLSDLCYVFFHKKIKEKNISFSKYQVIEAQNKILKKEMENEASFRRLKHDLKNTLLQVDMNVKRGNNELAIKQIEEIIGEKIDYPTYLSGLPEIDYLLSIKTKKMKKRDIDYKLKLQLPRDLDIKDISIYIFAILGNLIDNAIEAVERLEVVKDPIVIEIIYREENIYISIKNPSEKLDQDFSKDFIKSSKSTRYGVGIKSIKLRVDKLKGFYNFKYEDGYFRALVIIPCAKKISNN